MQFGGLALLILLVYNGVVFGCDLCSDQWILVIANGRSGSTTIVDMLNELPDVYVAGERTTRGSNEDIVSALHSYYTYATTSNERQGPHQTLNKVEEHAALCASQAAFREAIGAYPNSTRAIGFKTLRASSANQLKWLLRVFPCARFVLNFRRDVASEFSSKKFFKKEGTTMKQLSIQARTLEHLSFISQRALAFPLEDFSVHRFNELRRFLGDKSQCEYFRVKHSNDGSFSSDKTPAVRCGEGSKYNAAAATTAISSKMASVPVATDGRIIPGMGEVRSPPRIYVVTPSQSVEALLRCYEARFSLSVFHEGMKVQGVQNYMAEDLGEYWMWKQILASGWRTANRSEAEVVLIDAFPMVSKTVGNCDGVTHDQRMKEVQGVYDERPSAFICTSWLCRDSIANFSLNWNHVQVAINELNNKWFPLTNLRANGVVVPYVSHHEIYPNNFSKHGMLFIGNMHRREPGVRSALGMIAKEHDVTIRSTNDKKSEVASYALDMMHAQFCFVPRGDSPTSRHLFDAIKAGCLPVVISDKIDEVSLFLHAYLIF